MKSLSEWNADQLNMIRAFNAVPQHVGLGADCIMVKRVKGDVELPTPSDDPNVQHGVVRLTANGADFST